MNMRPEDKKYVWWGLLGIGVAALFYFLNSSKQSSNANTVTVPYLVPQSTTGASPTADTSLSNQPNIIGNSPNSTIPNFSNPFAVAANPSEAPGTWGFMPILTNSNPTNNFGQVHSGWYTTPNGTFWMNPGNPSPQAFPESSAPNPVGG
jgi:hypothetical protein